MHMISSEKTTTILGVILTGVLVGAIVALLTSLLGMNVIHLPGGSLGAGYMVGVTFPWRNGIPRWQCVLIGMCAGIVGWLLILLYGL